MPRRQDERLLGERPMCGRSRRGQYLGQSKTLKEILRKMARPSWVSKGPVVYRGEAPLHVPFSLIGDDLSRVLLTGKITAW